MVKLTLQCGHGTLESGGNVYRVLEGTDILNTFLVHKGQPQNGEPQW